MSYHILSDGVSYKGQSGITFERIKGKRSIARAISEEPERIEEFMHLYTQAVKKLHQTKCDTTLFDPVLKSYSAELEKARDHFTEEEYVKIKNFMKDNENFDTCIHGDLHIGNVLLTEDNDVLFIDMADFSYGNPYFDVATFFVMAYIIGDEQVCRKESCRLQPNPLKKSPHVARQYPHQTPGRDTLHP